MQRAKQQTIPWTSIGVYMLLALFCYLYPPTLYAQADSIQASDIEYSTDETVADLSFFETPNTPPYIPSEATIQKYKKQHRFNYKLDTETDTHNEWFARYFFKFLNFLQLIISNRAVMLVLLVCLLTLIIWILVRIGLIEHSVIQRSNKLNNTNGYDLDAENILGYDFDKLIAEAIQQKEYRLATRLSFLRNLKALSDKGIIKWDKKKTNNNYIYEITHEALRKNYMRNSLVFDYVWYGEFEIDEADFKVIYQQYEEFHKNVMNHAI